MRKASPCIAPRSYNYVCSQVTTFHPYFVPSFYVLITWILELHPGSTEVNWSSTSVGPRFYPWYFASSQKSKKQTKALLELVIQGPPMWLLMLKVKHLPKCFTGSGPYFISTPPIIMGKLPLRNSTHSFYCSVTLKNDYSCVPICTTLLLSLPLVLKSKVTFPPWILVEQ